MSNFDTLLFLILVYLVSELKILSIFFTKPLKLSISRTAVHFDK